ncbi:hypothetical protein BDU57DRAFT_533043 [Ampelomyces quisqualis]|uniref:Uncharacterized protein n=1 Tax=Ampelomyces quisqualis TaxID=50730 RepID=A0A6A5Q9V5_AMPQU|nr:hypothetical protein BDU57DRAFT_533043 [Ampelomyces quisqualis]
MAATASERNVVIVLASYPQVVSPTGFTDAPIDIQPPLLARGHVFSPSRDFSDPPQARARQSKRSCSIIPSKKAHSLHPSPAVSEPGSATVAPAHRRTALARPWIKIACDPTANSSTAPCACALPSSVFSSHDGKCARTALEQILTSRDD